MEPLLLELPSAIRGERVVARPFARGDGPGIFAAVDEDRAHLRAWLPWVDHHVSPKDSECYARTAWAKWILREDLAVALVDEEDRVAGGSGLHRFDWEVGGFEIGYWLKKSAEGRGLVTEAVTLLTALAFDRLSANRVEIRCDPRNERSARVPRGLGFELEGVLHNQSRDPGGLPRDTMVYALTPESFAERPWNLAALARVRAADRLG